MNRIRRNRQPLRRKLGCSPGCATLSSGCCGRTGHMSNLKKISIDGIEVEVDRALTIFQAAE
jgi:hypothetical protein